jgi:hypothetical protein
VASWEELSYRVAGAQGMVSVQADCTLADALVMMIERAHVQHETLTQIAEDVLERRIRFGV